MFRGSVQKEVKTLITCLTAFMLCLGLTATAQTSSGKTGQATVTSTIRVRIPAFASITLAENKSSVIPVREAVLTVSEKEKADFSALQSNTNWMMNVDRILNEAANTLAYSKRESKQAPVINLVYTATPL